MDVPALLAQPHLTVVSAEPDPDLRQIERLITHRATVDGRLELEMLFGRLLDQVDPARVAPKTLDLVGHTRTAASLLTLGDWVIDATRPAVTAFFRELADHDVLPRLGVHAVRLLGCNSADTAPGRATLCKLRDLLGLEVHGASHLLHAAHYGSEGFRDCWSFLLVAASDIERTARRGATPPVERDLRVFDIDALPRTALAPRPDRYPVRVATGPVAGQILRLIRRDEGARMPGLLASPTCELALPSAEPGAYHLAHVLLDGEFLRFYPDGMAAAGIVYPVDDAAALRRIIAALPRLGELTG